EEVGEIARFESPHDFVNFPFLVPDGRHVLYATSGELQDNQWLPGTDPALWFGDLADPKNPRKFTSQAPLNALALSRDGRVALTTSSDQSLRIWDVETGKSRRVRRSEVSLGQVAFAPDEHHAAYVHGDTIRYCDLETGEESMTFRGHSGGIRSFAFCPDGRWLVSGGVDDHTIRVWNVKTGEEVRKMKHGHGVMAVAAFPDSRRVLTASWDETIGVWDLETGQQLRRICGVADNFGARVAIAPDGRRALFGTEHDHAVRLWDLETGEEIERFDGHTGDPWHVSFAPDGRRAVSGSSDKTARVWALPPGRPPGQEPPLLEVAHFLGHEDVVETVVVSPDGRRILSGSFDNTMILWDRESAQPIRRFRELGGQVYGVAISPDGRRALSGGSDNLLRLWDLDSGELVRKFTGHAEAILAVAFSPDGRLAYSTSGGPNPWTDGSDSVVRVWDLETGDQIRGLGGHKGRVGGLDVSIHGHRLLTGGDKTLILWDTDLNGTKESRRFQGDQAVIANVAFLSDGRRAVSACYDRTIRLWDLEAGTELKCFRGHTDEVTWVAASPDGRRLLSSDYRGRDLRLWDVESGTILHRFNDTAGQLGIAVSASGNDAVTADTDGNLRLWRLPRSVTALP
ncbi:WD40 repeat domain-containing protein, partial [Singulisphaera rosea]